MQRGVLMVAACLAITVVLGLPDRYPNNTLLDDLYKSASANYKVCVVLLTSRPFGGGCATSHHIHVMAELSRQAVRGVRWAIELRRYWAGTGSCEWKLVFTMGFLVLLSTTSHQSTQPNPLRYCNFYNDLSCCTSMADEEIIQDITALLTTGVSCIYHDEIRMDPLGQIYCLPCDPNQPAYIRDVNYTTSWPTSGGANLQSVKSPTVLVCADWAEYEFVTKGGGYPLSMYDKCGLDMSAPCTDSNKNILTGRNRYVCGDNKVYPSVTYTSNGGVPLTPLEAVEALLNDYQIGVRSLTGLYSLTLVADSPL